MNSDANSDTVNFKINNDSDDIKSDFGYKYWADDDGRVAVLGTIRDENRSS